MEVSEIVTSLLSALVGGIVALVGVKLIDHFSGLRAEGHELWSRRLGVYSELSDRVQELIIAGFTSAYTTGDEKQAAITRYNDSLKTLTESWARFQLVFGEKVAAPAQDVFYAIIDMDTREEEKELVGRCEALLERQGRLLRSMRQDLHGEKGVEEMKASFETSMRERLRQALRLREVYPPQNQPTTPGDQP